jgi:hypothetical protein
MNFQIKKFYENKFIIFNLIFKIKFILNIENKKVIFKKK